MVFYAPQGLPQIPSGPQPSKKRSGLKIFLIIVGAVVVGFFGLIIFISILGAILFGGDDEPVDAAAAEALVTSSPSQSAGKEQETPKPVEKKATEPTYAIGQSVTSKKFEYVVTGYQCGIPSVGEYEITKEVAKGQFCRLSISAKNIAKQAEKLDFDDFKLISGDIEFSTDSWINIKSASGTDSSGFLDKINPGLQVTGNIYFDVPLEVIPDRAMIDDSLFGKPATVNLK